MRAENEDPCRIAKAAGIELEKSYTQTILMNKENACLRQQLHTKKNKRKRTYTTTQARLMTSEEMSQKLLEVQRKQMGELHKGLRQAVFLGIRARHAQEANADKAAKKAEKVVERETTKAAREAEKAAAKAAKAAKAAETKAAKAAKAAGVAARGRGRARGRPKEKGKGTR
ncbi:hypothetical protein B0H17DRAFT_1207477 [Mycena rosella]|uniref:Uncharacterized protein n=1 Tax=Mycena rosella TaxID=1033263 RepID=A0AAD7G7W4_MYCRO|nr:hypothetical protein B0H17DRAFT_1207477 [Mycena rosella]